jgi:hypothetical protein
MSSNLITPELQAELDKQVSKVKEQRKKIQEIHDEVSKMERTRSNATTLTKLDEASMWLGKRLQELQVANPYPTSMDPSITTIDKTAPEACNLPSN